MVKKYVNEENLQTAMTEYNKRMTKGSEVTDQYDRTVGYVSKVYDNETGAGEQIYAVVPTEAEVTGNPEAVEEVTVLFRGSTSPDKVFMQGADVWNDWIENDVLIGLRIWGQNHPNYSKDYDHATAQLQTAAKDLKELMALYPNAQFKLYAHSLGSMQGQYAIADLPAAYLSRIEGAYLYNAPNIYGLMTKQQKNNVDQIKGRIQNYVDPRDWISMVGRRIDKGSAEAVGQVFYVDSRKAEGMAAQHMTYGYELTEDGAIKTLNAEQAMVLVQVDQLMTGYYQLKKRLMASGGGLDSQETFFLDSEQSMIITSGIHQAASLAAEDVKAYRDEASSKAEELYQKVKEIPWFVTELTAEEVQAAYAEAGVTYESMVGKTERHFDKKVKNMETAETVFSDLEADVQAGTEAALEADSSLAGEIASWQK
ncbi:DUF2974 domain-containing protein [Streptococcus chenjunshii]|uniref:DUF2974 domain-containing protein n=3 Tax=Streptococcus chenjunshii TaxID=2173853 RepID=A0A346NE37_9STRE|nr:Mbeg1-like protein [Streptococcus chenjunshii]AXQ79282.1 DUF2974 domain-containing protein [Streptococcus chenjunshii]